MNAFVEQYNQKLLIAFLNRQGMEKIQPPIEGRIRVWFNEDLESRNFIVPGIIAVIIMIVGAMLTSLVIAREYENGTMETIKALPLTSGEFLIGKAIPYFFVGMTDVLISILMGQVLFGIVMKSSFWLMIAASSIYLGVALALGLFISTVTQSGGHTPYVPPFPAPVEFCFSRRQHAEVSSVGDIYCASHLLYRYFERHIFAEPRSGLPVAELCSNAHHVRHPGRRKLYIAEERGHVT